MLSCREAARLVSEARDRGLRAGERVALGLHLLICVLCRRYARQLAWLAQLAGTATEQDAKAQDARLDAAARERIRRHLP
jgi:hypothetical protein